MDIVSLVVQDMVQDVRYVILMFVLLVQEDLRKIRIIWIVLLILQIVISLQLHILIKFEARLVEMFIIVEIALQDMPGQTKTGNV